MAPRGKAVLDNSYSQPTAADPARPLRDEDVRTYLEAIALGFSESDACRLFSIPPEAVAEIESSNGKFSTMLERARERAQTVARNPGGTLKESFNLIRSSLIEGPSGAVARMLRRMRRYPEDSDEGWAVTKFLLLVVAPLVYPKGVAIQMFKQGGDAAHENATIDDLMARQKQVASEIARLQATPEIETP